jgi:hypothetical protein
MLMESERLLATSALALHSTSGLALYCFAVPTRFKSIGDA